MTDYDEVPTAVRSMKQGAEDYIPKKLIEANTATASIINGMARMHLLDKIILCTIPVIAGNGCRLFLGDLPESEWMRDETARTRVRLFRK